MSGLVIPMNLNGQGLVAVKSVSQMIEEETAAAQRAQQQPLIQGLAGYVKQCFDAAWQAKQQTLEERLHKCVRQRRGEYDPDFLAGIRKTGGSEIYMMLTTNKCRAAASWIKDVMSGTKDDSVWSIEPTSEPELRPEHLEEVIQGAVREAMLLEQQVGMGMIGPEQMRDLMQRFKDQKITQMREKGEQIMKRMRSKMEDQLQEGGFYEALDAFIDDLVTFPFAVLKGPVPRKRKRLTWVPSQGGYTAELSDVIQLEWDRVDPFMLFWAPHATDVDDGFIIERHQLTRNDLEALLGVEGYDDGAIRGVLDEHGRRGLHSWLWANDATRADTEGKSLSATYSNPEATIDALQFWGSVQGKQLIDHGMNEEQVPDPLKSYDVEVWVIGNWVIKAVLNGNPLGHKPYYKTSYECIPGSWAGNGVADLVRDTQRMCNGAARALANNMGIASGPMGYINIQMLASGEDVTQLYPWRMFQTKSDEFGQAAKPLEFFQPNSNAQELMTIYEKFSVLADEYSGVPRYMTGDAPAGGAGRTATGMSMLMGNAGKSIKQVIGNIDMDVTRPLIERLYYYNMAYSDDPELKGDVRVVARGVNVLVAKEQAQVRMNELLQIVASNPMFVQIVGEEAIADMLREVTRPLNMDIVPPKEVIRARMIQRQMLEAAMMQQGRVIEGEASKVGKKTVGPNRQRLGNGAPIADNFQPKRAA